MDLNFPSNMIEKPLQRKRMGFFEKLYRNLDPVRILEVLIGLTLFQIFGLPLLIMLMTVV